jgi:uncharacterized protein (DUF433 family)
VRPGHPSGRFGAAFVKIAWPGCWCEEISELLVDGENPEEEGTDMAKAKARLREHPYIERRSGVRGGVPVIAETGVKVLDVAIRYEVMGMTPEEILVALPHLDLPQIHAALSYYYAHKTQMDEHWKASLRNVARLRAKTSSVLEEKLGSVKNLHG